MGAQTTAKRRRRQHANGFAHLTYRQRPNYPRTAGGGGGQQPKKGKQSPKNK
jgi:hypothetical protein